MARPYLTLAKKSFQNNLVYRVDYVAGVINAIVMIFVNLSIWKAIYEEEEALVGVQFKLLATYIVLSFLMQVIFAMDDYFVENKVRSGLISTDLLKPIGFRRYVFAYQAGNLAFRLSIQVLPALLLSIFLFHVLPPFSAQTFVLFVASAILGYLVLYQLNFLVWLSSFWFYWTFSLVTIKDAVVMILSGALIPLWFMPPWLSNFIKLTPFDSIFYTPIQIYLGMIPAEEIASSLIRQSLWVIVLYAAGHVLWKAASRKLVVQGG